MAENKTYLNIKDFNLFFEIIKTLSKMSGGVKMTVGECLTVYAKNDFSRCELTSNAVTSQNEISFCLGDLGMFLKILTTVKGIYEGDFSPVKICYEAPFIKIESKKFKTKISTVEEDRILNFIGAKVHTVLTPRAEFTTSSDIIKNINSHSFIFNDSGEPRIYLMANEEEMENNMVFASIGNRENDLANSMTLELGMLNDGSLEDTNIILDFNRINMLNMVPSEEIKVSVAKERPVLMSNVRRTGVNDTFFDINVYVFMMVK